MYGNTNSFVPKSNGSYSMNLSDIMTELRAGRLDNIPIGTTFTASGWPHSNFIVRRKNVDRVSGYPSKPTITIQATNLTGSARLWYDWPEALVAVTSTIPAGTVCKFTISKTVQNWAAGTYWFKATNAIPAGSKLAPVNPTSALSGNSMAVWASARELNYSASYAISSGSGGATKNLGTAGVELNHPKRVMFGSDNYAESNIHQWLNSASTLYETWVPKTKFDMLNPYYLKYPDSSAYMKNMNSYLKSCLALASVHNITNIGYEAPDSVYTKNSEYYFDAYFWYPSRTEIYGKDSYSDSRVNAESQFPAYAQGLDESFTDSSSDLEYWAFNGFEYFLRSPLCLDVDDVGAVNVVRGDGSSRTGPWSVMANEANSFAPLALLA